MVAARKRYDDIPWNSDHVWRFASIYRALIPCVNDFNVPIGVSQLVGLGRVSGVDLVAGAQSRVRANH